MIPSFAAWVKRYRVRALLIRPDRFIAARLDPQTRDLTVLDHVRRVQRRDRPANCSLARKELPMSLQLAIKRGPGSIELPRSPSPLVKAHELSVCPF